MKHRRRLLLSCIPLSVLIRALGPRKYRSARAVTGGDYHLTNGTMTFSMVQVQSAYRPHPETRRKKPVVHWVNSPEELAKVAMEMQMREGGFTLERTPDAILINGDAYGGSAGYWLAQRGLYEALA